MGTTLYWTNEDSGELVVVKFDATLLAEPEDSGTVTDHPVEEGANVVDHVRDNPERLTLEGLVTNTPHQGNLTEEDDHETTTVTLDVKLRKPFDTAVKTLDVPDPPLEISPGGLIQAGVGAITDAITGGPNRKATVNVAGGRGSTRADATVLASESNRNRARIAYEKLLDARQNRALITVQTPLRDYFDMLLERVSAPRSAEDGSAHRFVLDLRRLRVAESETVQSPEPAEARGSAGKSLGSQAAKTDPNGDAKLESIAHQELY